MTVAAPGPRCRRTWRERPIVTNPLPDPLRINHDDPERGSPEHERFHS